MLCDKSTDGRPCTDAETGEPCAQCQAAVLEQIRLWRAQYDGASPAERDPAGYATDMVEAGRGHLLTEEQKGMVRR